LAFTLGLANGTILIAARPALAIYYSAMTAPEAQGKPKRATTLQWSSVIVLAKDINQSIFRPGWLLKHGILLEEEADAPEAVFAPGITQVPTKHFELLVLPDRIQVRLLPDIEDATPFLARVIGGTAKTLPHTPFRAVGINFEHRLEPATPGGFFEWDVARLASPWALGNVEKCDRRARFGCSFAHDFMGARMRVRATVSASDSEKADHTKDTIPYGVTVSCNLHRDLPTDGWERELARMLSMWPSTREHADKIVRSLE
jgi:hypothetical protein